MGRAVTVSRLKLVPKLYGPHPSVLPTLSQERFPQEAQRGRGQPVGGGAGVGPHEKQGQ